MNNSSYDALLHILLQLVTNIYNRNVLIAWTSNMFINLCSDSSFIYHYSCFAFAWSLFSKTHRFLISDLTFDFSEQMFFKFLFSSDIKIGRVYLQDKTFIQSWITLSGTFEVRKKQVGKIKSKSDNTLHRWKYWLFNRCVPFFYYNRCVLFRLLKDKPTFRVNH